MNGLVYTLQLIEPILSNSLAGDANSARSLPYVPGGLVRGALIGLYLSENKLDEVDASDEKFRRLFLNGETRYLHAFPCDAKDKDRTLPPSLAWKVEKDNSEGSTSGTDIFNLATAIPDQDDLKRVSFSSGWRRGETIYSLEFPLQVNVHTQRDAVLGRAKEGTGAVFRYEALPSGLLVKGIILTPTKKDAEILKILLSEGELLLGKARTAGYGSVHVQDVKELDTEWREGWCWDEIVLENTDEDGEYPEPEPLEEAQQFTLTFLSAGLVRDGRGQYSLDPLPALNARLDTSLQVIEESLNGNTNISMQKIFRSPEVVGGFNRTWGLPLPQTAAIAPGSVFVLATEKPIAIKDLCALEEIGLGERRAEGFGRITIDLEQPKDIQWVKKEPDHKTRIPQDEASTAMSGATAAIAQIMLTRLLRRDLEQAILKTVQDNKINGRISNNQLSRWQVMLRSALTGDTPAARLKRLTRFYAEEKKKGSPAWQQMHRARVGRERRRLTSWINDVLTGKNAPWKQLGYGDENIPERRLGDNISIKPNPVITLEYKIRLIDATLAAHAKRQGGTND